MSKKLTMEELLLSAGYSAKAIKLYMNKVNVGSLENSDVALTYTGLPCGDTITLYLKLGKDGTIQDAKFEYKGCIGTASSGSALTMLVIGKTVKEAWNITKDDILKELGGLPESHCAELAINALHKALEKLEAK
jgi:NifU-like protein involved in Fe-S cluster formation